jgi:hypothetical protein
MVGRAATLRHRLQLSMLSPELGIDPMRSAEKGRHSHNDYSKVY